MHFEMEWLKKKKSFIKLYIILRAGVKAPHSYVKVLHMDRKTQKGLQKELKSGSR